MPDVPTKVVGSPALHGHDGEGSLDLQVRSESRFPRGKKQGGSKLPHSKVATATAAAAQKILTAILLVLSIAGLGYAADAGSQKVRPERYEIDVRFEPEKGFLRAKATVTLQANAGTKAIEFELNPHLKIREVTDGQGRKLEFARSQRLGSPKLIVKLAEAVAADRADQRVAITFVYEGVIPSGELDYITKDGILLRDESRWYPAVDLSAFTQNAFSIRVPLGWDAVTSGSRQSSPKIEDGTVLHEWITKRQVSSRSLAAYPNGPKNYHCADQLLEFREPPGDYEVCLFLPAEKQEPSRPIAGKVRDILHGYGKQLGARGVGGIKLLQGFPAQQGAIGYSAPGFIVVGEGVVKYHEVPGWAPEFLPHEVAHQWFPIQVTLGREEDGWLAEGLAEYLAWRYLQEKEPEQARLMVARAMRDALEPEPLRPLSLGLKLFGLESRDVLHKTLYQRGMLVFRTLETVIGRSRVDAALREYYKRFAGRSAGIGDFRKVCEEISERDLSWFFEYFINGTEIPELVLRRLPASAPNEYLGEIVFKNVPPEFQVRVEMKFFTSAGVVENSVATRGEVTPFSMNLPAPAARAMLDPDLRILRWTEAARRNLQQKKNIESQSEQNLPKPDSMRYWIEVYRATIALDPENLASNHQDLYFGMARRQYLLKQYDAAMAAFERVLNLNSIEPMQAEFNRVWARAYRAKMAKVRGNLKAAREDANAGLAMHSPALDTAVQWPEAAKETTARAELHKIMLPSAAPAKRPGN